MEDIFFPKVQSGKGKMEGQSDNRAQREVAGKMSKNVGRSVFRNEDRKEGA